MPHRRVRNKSKWVKMPALNDAIFTGITITPAGRKKFAITNSNDSMNPTPPYTAEFYVYDVELTCKDLPRDERSKVDFAEHVQRLIEKLYRTEQEFFPHTDDKSDNPFPKITVDWNQHPPIAKINDSVGLDMLHALVRLKALEANLDVAKAIEKATLAEYRGPLMASRVEYDWAPPEDYEREKLIQHDENSIGDFGSAAAQDQYAKAVNSLQQGIARGHIKDDGQFKRDTVFTAAMTLKGLLPSPYPTAQKLLADSKQPDNEHTRREMLKNRIKEILVDVLGEDHTDLTIAEHAERLRAALTDKISSDRIPEWWTGDAAGWKARLDTLRGNLDEYRNNMRELKKKGGLGVLFAEIAEQCSPQNLLKQELKDKRAQSDELPAVIPDSRADLDLSVKDMTFFGVTHTMKDGYDRGDKNAKEVIYTSRNPIMDPPRPLPRVLSTLLAQERRTREISPPR